MRNHNIALALVAASAFASLAATPASAYNIGPMIGRVMQGFARPAPRQAQVQQNRGTRVCKMCDDTSGGQQTQDCAGWGHNLHEQVIWENNCGGNRVGPGGVQVLNGGGRGVTQQGPQINSGSSFHRQVVIRVYHAEGGLPQGMPMQGGAPMPVASPQQAPQTDPAPRNVDNVPSEWHRM
jgi:hypothetical protein